MRYYKKYQRGVYLKKSLKDLKGGHKLAREKQRRRLPWWKKPAELQAREETNAQLMKGWMAAQNMALSLANQHMGLRAQILWISQAVMRKDELWRTVFNALRVGNGNFSAHLERTSKEMNELNERIKAMLCMELQRGIRSGRA